MGVLSASGADNVVISEFMARNSTGIVDEDGSNEDWIEIFNGGTNSVNLLNWSLSDKASNPTKWQFPATNIAPGSFMIIWASNKDRHTAGSPLHTNFKLASSLGYLGLFRPDGSIATQFSPVYQPQAVDISYGFPSVSTTNALAPLGLAARYLVPPNFSVDTLWQDPAFNDSTWSNATTGLAFTNQVWVIQADSFTDFSGTQRAKNWSAGYYNKTADTVIPGYQASNFTIFPNTGPNNTGNNYWTGSAWDYFGANPPWTYLAANYWHPNGTNNTNNVIAGSELWSIRRWTANTNGILRVDWSMAKQNVGCGNGVTGYILHNGTQKDAATIAFNDAIGVSRTVFLTNVAFGDVIDFALTPQGTDGLPTDSCDGSYGQMQILVPSTTTDISSRMQNTNSTVYARIPFNVDGPSAAGVNSLFLRVRYSDGFVAHLNGIQVARRNAPSNTPGGVLANSTNDWSATGVQGNNNWYYGYYDYTSDTNSPFAGFYRPSEVFNASDATWNFVTNKWVLGLDDPPYTMISATTWQPNGTNNFANHWPIRRWISPVNGQVTARVFFAKAVSGGNGATLRVYVNGVSKVVRTIAGTDTVGITTNILLGGVELGDLVDFALDPLGTDGQTGDTSDLCYFGATLTQTPLSDPSWNSAATADSTLAESQVGELIDISAFRDFLYAGTNVLAVQGLNSSASDPGFVLLPELLGVSTSLNTNQPVYFQVPTPGVVNGLGTTNLGPLILDVSHTPHEPATNEAVTVTARVVQTFGAVSNLTLRYRVMFGSEVAVSMFDDGLHGDGAAADGVWGGIIPTSVMTNGQMIRYYLVSSDVSGATNREPTFLSAKDSPQYLGFVVKDPSIVTALPVLHWFIQTPAGANNDIGTNGSIYYNGQFRDNITATLHGQSSSSFPKHSYNFNMVSGNKLTVVSNYPSLSDFAVITTWADRTHARVPLNTETYAAAGTPAHYAFPLQMRQNGAFFSIATFSEQGNEKFLERIGYDSDGALYKMYNTFTGAAGNEKKTRKYEPAFDLQAFYNNLTAGGVTYLYDNVNIPEVINYLATKSISSDHDCCHKNYYFYRDSNNTGEWFAFPWDFDLSYGHVWTSTNGNYLDDTMYTNVPPNIGNNNTLFALMYNDPALKEMWMRRTRSLMDQILQPLGTTPADDVLRARLNYYSNYVSADAALDKTKWGAATWVAPSPVVGGPANPTSDLGLEYSRLEDFYLPGRRFFLYRVATNTPYFIPPVQTNMFVSIGVIDYNPASSNQAQEYIEIINTNRTSVDISGWRIRGGVDFTFAPGTILSSTNRIYVSPDVKSFRARATGPRSGQRLMVVGPYQGQLSARGETVTLVNSSGQTNATVTYVGTPSAPQQYLRITEIMYHPAPVSLGNPYGQEDYEYIEVKNISTNVTLNLNGVKFTNGVEFAFAGSAITSLAPGQRCLVVRSNAAFAQRYGAGLPVAGAYIGSLDNSGERIQLLDAFNEEILDFSYNNSWYPITDGLGFSLVVVDENAETDAWDTKTNWRPSGNANGNPGAGDPGVSVFAPILVNEALTHTDLPQVDAAELYNPTATNVDVGGWFLTDDFNTPKKYRIPNGTSIPAGGYLVLTETNFNPGGLGFSFSSTGDEVYLFSGNAVTNLTGYYHGFAFGAIENGVSFGRYVNSQGEEDFVPQSANTLGGGNAAPRVGPIVISEIMYNPASLTSNDPPAAYIELLNLASNNVPLYTLSESTNTWHLRNSVDFDFPANVVLPPGGALLVVGFDPTNTTLLTSFRTRYGVGAAIPIYGPWQGSLPNNEGTIELKKPDFANTNGVPYVQMEKVHYHDSAPWTPLADGLGASLTRVVLGDYGNDPTNWVAAFPSPGTNYNTGSAPQITTQPQSQAALAGSNVTLSVTASGTGPFNYQWTANGLSSPITNNPVLTLNKAQRSQSGQYQVLIMTPYGAILSAPATLLVQASILFTTQPQSQSLLPLQNVTFSSVVSGDAPIYRWLSNGVPVTGATNSSYTKPNLQPGDGATYTVSASNAVSSALSAPATLTIILHPLITVQPTNFSVFATSNATFSVGASSTSPLRYQWLFGTNNLFVTNVLVAATNNTLVVTNAQDTNSGFYAVQVSDTYGAILSTNATLDVQTKASYVQQPSPTNGVALVGSSFTFNLRARGALPITYKWRKGLTTLSTNALYDTLSSYTIASVQHTNAGTYDATITNVFSTSPIASSKAFLTVIDPLTNQSARVGSNVTFNFLASTLSPTNTTAGQSGLFLNYRWFFNGTNLLASVTGTSTVVNVSLTLTNVQFTNEGSYTAIATNASNTVVSQTASLSMLRPPSILTQPTNLTLMAGTSASFTVAADGSAPLTYRWLLNGVLLGAPSSPTLSLASAQLSDAGGYSVIVSNSENSVTSVVATLTVLSPPIIVTQPVSVGVLASSNAAFTVVGQGNPAPAYQWYFNLSHPLGTATSDTLLIPNVQSSDVGLYQVVLSNTYGMVTSAVATLVIVEAPTIRTPPADQSVRVNSNATFLVEVDGTAPFSYQWFFNATNLLAGATDSTLVLTNVQGSNAGNYRVVISNAAGSVVSAASLTVLSPPAFTLQPASQLVNSNAGAVFAVQATGAAPLSYQWWFNETNLLVGEVNSALAIASAQNSNAGSYNVIVTNFLGAATSTLATLSIRTPPSVVTQPTNLTVLSGSNAAFSVEAGGTAPLAYQWVFNATNLLTDATNTTVSLTNVQPANGGNYQVRISNPAGSATSVVAILTVLVAPSITQPPTNLTVAAGATANFAVVAGGSQPLSYQWRLGGADLGGATSAGLSIPGAQPANGGGYSVVVSNAAGSVTSVVATLIVLVPPAIVTQPTNLTVIAGANAAFVATAQGSGPLAYQWFFNLTNVLGGGTNATLSLTNAQTANAGAYQLVVSNAIGTATSAVASLTVLVPPAITQQPTNITVVTGATANFTVAVSGSGPFGYQWRFGGNDLNSATGSSLAVVNAQPGDAGGYSVVVTNSAGSVTSAVATLTVLVPPAIVTQPTNTTANTNTTAVFTVIASGSAPLSYQWWFNQTNLLSGAINNTLTISSVQPSNSGSYRVVVTNAAGVATSQSATLTVPDADSDGDGMTDIWELAHGLDPHSAADAGLDSDGDKMSNLQEYIAGTDPHDPASNLKVVIAADGIGTSATISFVGVSGKSYSVLYRNFVDTGSWLSLTNLPALGNNQTVTVIDPSLGSHLQRVYRIVTPAQP